MQTTCTEHVTRICSANNLQRHAWHTCLHSSGFQPCTGSWYHSQMWQHIKEIHQLGQYQWPKLVLKTTGSTLAFFSESWDTREGFTVMNCPGWSSFSLWTKKITSSCFQWGIKAKEQYQQPRLLCCWGQSYLEVLSISFLYIFTYS